MGRLMDIVTERHADDLHGGTKKSKIEQYSWSVKDSAGTLSFIDKTSLMVDRSYQRHENQDKVLRMARAWSHVACGAITVARRAEDSNYYVIDGQHRVLAARKRSDIQKLPCIIFDTESAMQEAGGFIDANTQRRNPMALEKWNAQLLRGDPATVFVNILLKQAGRTPSGAAGPNTVRCLARLLAAAQINKDALARIWPLIIDLCNGKVLHERILDGLFYIEHRMPPSESLSDKRLYDRIIKVGYGELMNAALRAMAFYARGGTRTWATGILDAINKGLHKKIAIDFGDA